MPTRVSWTACRLLAARTTLTAEWRVTGTIGGGGSSSAGVGVCWAKSRPARVRASAPALASNNWRRENSFDIGIAVPPVEYSTRFRRGRVHGYIYSSMNGSLSLPDECVIYITAVTFACRESRINAPIDLIPKSHTEPRLKAVFGELPRFRPNLSGLCILWQFSL